MIFPYHVYEKLVNTQVRRELGVKRGGERRTLADRDDPTGARLGPDDLDARASLLDPRRADEHRAELGAGDAAQRDVALERVHLAAERVPADGHVDPAERLLPVDPVRQPVRQHDHPGAGAERRHA
jgi:hypothetical protein